MRKDIAIGAVLVAVAAGVYAPLIRCDFVNYDDPGYVRANRAVRQGISWANVAWAFTSTKEANWHPLTWLSHMAVCQFFGTSAGWHHAANLALHLASTVLLYAVLRRMTGSRWPSALVAALFALHPLHVESVAWVAERKDVLSTVFWMMTMLAYARYAARPGIIRYLPVFVFLALGLMAKPMLVTLPLVLLLLDYWPLGRLTSARSLPRLAVEKIPLFALSAASCIVTYWVQHTAGTTQMGETVPLAVRIENAVMSYVAYLGKTVWPMDLAVFYPYPMAAPLLWQTLGAAVILIAVTAAVIWQMRRRPYLAVGWFWYLGTLVPVIGLVQVGEQAMADRFTYIPLIGIFIAAVWGVADALAARPIRAKVLVPVSAAVLVACSALTWRQLGYWTNSESLFRHALALTQDNWLAHVNLGTALLVQGRLSEAADHFNEALRIRPCYPTAHNNLGMVLATRGRYLDAIAHFRAAMALDPADVRPHGNLGAALSKIGDPEGAIVQYREALRIDPEDAGIRNNLALDLARLGRLAEADAEHREALRLEPANADFHTDFSGALYGLGKYEEAIDHCREAVRLDPNAADAQNNWGAALDALGRREEAIVHYREALRANPAHAGARANLAEALRRIGQTDEAGKPNREAPRP
jgi:Flp pilus assembly protein TadD